MKNTIIVTCCNKKYEKFIPLFCMSLALFNDDIVIEIGISSKKLPDETETILENIRKDCNIEIQIDYELFKEEDNYVVFNNQKTLPNTVRFLFKPKMKAKYVYISDIDIINLQKNFYELMIKDMEKNNINYSNIVRPNTTRLTGLHFSKYNTYYPISTENIKNYIENDEMILYKIVSSKCAINHSLTYRPVHGIHISPNRKLDNKNGPNWGCSEIWKENYFNMINSVLFVKNYKYFDKDIKTIIKQITDYYINKN